MKSLAIQNGDLVLGPDGFATVSGASKVRQDLGIALREPVGSDRFHPQWGSLLPRYIGNPIGDTTIMVVRSETYRVIQNYVYIQAAAVRDDVSRSRKARYGASEIIKDIQKVDVRQDHSRLMVKVHLVTLGNDDVTLVQDVRP